eukprot:m.792227 g.792227  ORF g.792227 m.792227 type:complete len:76 (+) comp23331_c0_seq53:4065-4292(+)
MSAPQNTVLPRNGTRNDALMKFNGFCSTDKVALQLEISNVNVSGSVHNACLCPSWLCSVYLIFLILFVMLMSVRF